MNDRLDLFWQLVTLVGRFRFLQRKSPMEITTEEFLEQQRKAVELDEFLEAVLEDTRYEDALCGLIEPNDPEHN